MPSSADPLITKEHASLASNPATVEHEAMLAGISENRVHVSTLPLLERATTHLR